VTSNNNQVPSVGEPVDEVLGALRGLAGEAPAGLADRVFAQWVSAPSELGEVLVAYTGEGVQYLRPAGDGGGPDEFARAYRDRFARPLRPGSAAPAGLLPTLRGRPARSLKLDLSGLSEFERSVLGATRRIPAGQVRPYGWVAREAGSPAAVRAVGTVLARNPVPLLVPCHRVVRADGALGQYMFGAPSKERLLRDEGLDVAEIGALAGRGVHYLASDTTGVVCFPSCRDARRITPAHRVEFRTMAKAEQAGFRPCEHCRPGPAPSALVSAE
jgi:O-6-methylguanine DNA methyltransferase